MSTDTNKAPCQGLAGWLFGHKFVGQYNATPPTSLTVESGGAAAVEGLIKAFTKTEYVCSVCQRCGEKE